MGSEKRLACSRGLFAGIFVPQPTRRRRNEDLKKEGCVKVDRVADYAPNLHLRVVVVTATTRGRELVGRLKRTSADDRTLSPSRFTGQAPTTRLEECP